MEQDIILKFGTLPTINNSGTMAALGATANAYATAYASAIATANEALVQRD